MKYRLTEEERNHFETDGYLIVEDALSDERVAALTKAVDIIGREYRSAHELGENDYVGDFDFIGKNDCFLELLDWPKTFPKVWSILGWNIQLYHIHLIITPPSDKDTRSERISARWHQDTGRLNQELEGDPRPRVSLKGAYFLTDTTEPGCGNLTVIPGSHLWNTLPTPAGSDSEPSDSIEIRVPPGTAVFFDRRLWHKGTPNHSKRTRKVLFYGYSYRWLRPRGLMTVAHLMDHCDPIRRQLLGASSRGGFGYTSPSDEDVPLKAWIEEHFGAEAVAP